MEPPRIKYDMWENSVMCKFILKELKNGNKNARSPCGSTIWKLAAKEKLLDPHSYQSMRDHMRRIVLPLLTRDPSKLDLDRNDVEYLIREFDLENRPKNGRPKQKPKISFRTKKKPILDSNSTKKKSILNSNRISADLFSKKTLKIRKSKKRKDNNEEEDDFYFGLDGNFNENSEKTCRVSFSEIKNESSYFGLENTDSEADDSLEETFRHSLDESTNQSGATSENEETFNIFIFCYDGDGNLDERISKLINRLTNLENQPIFCNNRSTLQSRRLTTIYEKCSFETGQNCDQGEEKIETNSIDDDLNSYEIDVSMNFDDNSIDNDFEIDDQHSGESEVFEFVP